MSVISAAFSAIETVSFWAGLVVTSAFGVPRNNASGAHTGTDFDFPAGGSFGATIPSPVAGQVVESNCSTNGGYGCRVTVAINERQTLLFAHLAEQSRLAVGDIINVGSAIGRIGSTGRSTGPHIHLEARTNGQPVDFLAHDNSAGATPPPSQSNPAPIPTPPNPNATPPPPNGQNGSSSWWRNTVSWIGEFFFFDPDTEGGIINDTIVGGIIDLVTPDIVEDAGATIADIASLTVEALQWMTNAENWWRLGFITFGATLMVVGFTGYVRETPIGAGAMKAVQSAAAARAGGAAAASQ